MIGFEPGFEARVVADEVRFNIPDYLLQAALDASYAAKDHTHPVSQITGLEGALTSYLTKTDAAATYETRASGWTYNDEIDSENTRFLWIDLVGGKFRTSWVNLQNKLKGFFDGIYQPKGNYQPSGSYATQASVDTKLPTNNGRANGFGANGDISQYSDGQTALWFRTAAGAEKTVIWTNERYANLNIRVNGKTSYVTTEGDIVAARDLKAPGWVYSGNGTANFQGNGNIVGSIWGNYGYGNDAYTAITNRIEDRAAAWARQEAGYARPTGGEFILTGDGATWVNNTGRNLLVSVWANADKGISLTVSTAAGQRFIVNNQLTATQQPSKIEGMCFWMGPGDFVRINRGGNGGYWLRGGYIG